MSDPPTPPDGAEPASVGTTDLYRPPAPRPLPPIPALCRALVTGERDLLTLLPAEAYRMRIGRLGYSRRGILLVNEPAIVRRILTAGTADYPKNDLFVGALAPLIGDGIFISAGDTWMRQRRMIEPAFGHMRVTHAFAHMAAAADGLERDLDKAAARGVPVEIDAATTRLTADIMVRTIFSQPLDGAMAREVFEQFAIFQKAVANVRVLRLVLGRAWAPIAQPPAAQAAAGRLRALLRRFIQQRLARSEADRPADICTDMIAARDPDSGDGFALEELIDQLGVFFLAGHETSAGNLAWSLFLLAERPDWADRLRAEIAATVGSGPVTFEHTRRLPLTRAVLREALRLYPPGPFLPRVAVRATEIEGNAIPRGAMVMIAPWLLHRHQALWAHPDRFDPARFTGAREKRIEPGSYIPFGLGPRVCVGAAFATVESTLILARLLRRYRFEAIAPNTVRPVARLTIGSAKPIRLGITLLR